MHCKNLFNSFTTAQGDYDLSGPTTLTIISGVSRRFPFSETGTKLFRIGVKFLRSNIFAKELKGCVGLKFYMLVP